MEDLGSVNAVPTLNSNVFIKPLHQLKNSLERKKPREEPDYEWWPVLFWLCQVEIITEHGLDDQQGQMMIIITVVVESATGQHLGSKCQLAFHSRSFRVSLLLLL